MLMLAADANALAQAEFTKRKEGILYVSAERKYTPVVPDNKLPDSQRGVDYAESILREIPWQINCS